MAGPGLDQAAPGFTLSAQTELVEQLGNLDGVAGRPAVVALAGTAKTTDQALFLVRAVRMLAKQHAEKPIAEVHAAGTVFAKRRDGRLVVPAAVDYVAWTERLSRFANRSDLEAKQRTILLTGRMSPRAKQEFEALGWHVAEHASD